MVTCPICKKAKLLPFIKSAVAGEYPPKLTAGIETDTCVGCDHEIRIDQLPFKVYHDETESEDDNLASPDS